MPDKTFTFEVDGDGSFKYDPPETWDYNRTDTIQVRSPSGRFTFRFIHVDSLGEPVAELSPVVVEGDNPHPASLVGDKEEGCEKFATDRVQIRDEPEIVAAGRAANVTKAAGYRYAIACEINNKLFVDATHGGAWGC
jgi:hypothetical protein